MKKKEYLMKELERLRKQQGESHMVSDITAGFLMSSLLFSPGEFLRKKRREKGGHKDPLLEEISLLQEEVMKQISMLRSEHEAAEKKRTELETVALILGLSPSDRPSGRSSAPREPEDGAAALGQRKAQEQRSPEEQWTASSSPRKVGGPAGRSAERAKQLQPLLSHTSPTWKVVRRTSPGRELGTSPLKSQKVWKESLLCREFCCSAC